MYMLLVRQTFLKKEPGVWEILEMNTTLFDISKLYFAYRKEFNARLDCTAELKICSLEEVLPLEMEKRE